MNLIFSREGINLPQTKKTPFHITTDTVKIQLGYVMVSLLSLQTICQILFNK